MKTSTVILLLFVVTHFFTLLNILLFDGNLNDLVFFFNSAICFAAITYYLWRPGDNKTTKTK